MAKKKRIPQGSRVPASRLQRKPSVVGASQSGAARTKASAFRPRALALFRERGATAAVAFLEAHVDAAGLPEELMGLARLLSARDPKSALCFCERVLRISDPPVEAMLLAGVLQDLLGQRSAAKSSVHAVVGHPDASPAQVLRAANLLVRYGVQGLALDAATKAFEALGRPLDSAAGLLYIAQATADWALVSQLTQQLRESYAANNISQARESPRTHLIWCDDEAVNIEVLKVWSARSLPVVQSSSSPIRPLEGRRLRVGYLSSDFREHPTARLINGVLRHHDRSRNELFMYCSGWDDGSHLRKEIETHFDHIHSVAGLSDQAAAQLIRSHGIDVLVELNGPTRANRMGILSYRPAPVQIDYLGWPGSVGGRVVDFIVGDYQTIPLGAEALYPERVIRLYPTYQANDHASLRLPPAPSRRQVGLPEDPGIVVLGMFNAVNKVHQAVWDAWMQIMIAVPKTVLWMLDPGQDAWSRITDAAKRSGVDASRILAAPRLKQQQHLVRLQCCDLMLDPWPYGGHTSTSDALFAGVPVVTLEGKNFAGRVSASLLKGAGLGDLVAHSIPEYVSRATQALSRPGELSRLQSFVREHASRSEVFDARMRARQLEQAYRAAFQRVVEGKPLAHINVKPPTRSTAQIFETLGAERASPQASAASQPIDWARYRIAVVTAYYRIDPEKLRRCCASVAAQTMRCDHFVVADGEPQTMPEGFDLIHMALPANVGNGGSTPKGIAGQYAFVQGYDAVAFLDADNWYEPNHIENAVRPLEDSNLDVVFARRHVIFSDGQVLTVEDPEDVSGAHVDTNCYVFSKRAAFIMSIFAMYPKEFGAGEDRYVRQVIDHLKLKKMSLPVKTVWYETNRSAHYKLVDKTPILPLRNSAAAFPNIWDPVLFRSRTGINTKT